MKRVYAVLNQKGGVGKTSACHHLAGAFSAARFRVLLIDNDPQASLTQGILGREEALKVRPDNSVAAIYKWGLKTPIDLVDLQWPRVPGVTLVPGSSAATRYDESASREVANWTGGNLAEWVRRHATRFDVVFIDCPPSIRGLARAAMGAATDLLVPVQPEDYGAQGLPAVLDAWAPYREAGANDPSIVLWMRDGRLKVHELYAKEIREAHGTAVLRAEVPRLQDFIEATLNRVPVSTLKPKGAAAAAIRELADELATRACRVPGPNKPESTEREEAARV